MVQLVALTDTSPQLDDPTTSATKAFKLSQLAGAQQQLAQSQQDDAAARAAFAANPTDGAARLSALAGVSPAAYSTEAKRQADLAASGAKTQSEQISTAKTKLQLAGQAFGYVMKNPTPDNASQAIDWLQQQGVYSPDDAAAHKAKIAANPGAVQQMATAAYQAALSAHDQLSKVETKDTGGQLVTQSTDPVTGQVNQLSSLAKTQTPEGIANRAQQERQSQRQTATQLQVAQLKSAGSGGDTDPDETVAQAMADGRIPVPTGNALRNGRNQANLSRALELNPQLSAGDFKTRSKADSDFSSGKLGSQVRSFNTSISHLDSLSGLADALDNNDTQKLNQIGNVMGVQFGADQKTNFDLAKKIVADETTKAIIGAGGTGHDRDTVAAAFDSANSPAQLKGAISTAQDLMVGQLNGLHRQYQSSTGKADFDRFLSPQSLRARQNHGGAPADLTSGSGKGGAGKVIDFGDLQ